MTRRANPRRVRAGARFDLDELAALGPAERERYADARLALLGEGFGRRVYLLSSRKVLKLARAGNLDEGRSQNRTEAAVAHDPAARRAVPRVYEAGPRHGWLVSELVRPLRRGEFKARTGLELDTVGWIAGEVEYGAELDALSLPPVPGHPDYLDRHLRHPLVRAVAAAVRGHGLAAVDLPDERQWGATSDGRVVLLDAGYTEQWGD